MADRDPLQEIDALIDALIPADDFVPAVLGAKLHAQLLEQDVELLDLWLHDHAEQMLTEQITRRLSRRRATAKRRRAQEFDEAAAAGDVGSFALTYVIDALNTRRRVASMTGVDHRFVADSYQRTGSTDLMLAAFHRAVAKKAGRKATSEVLTEQQYDALLTTFEKRLAS